MTKDDEGTRGGNECLGAAELRRVLTGQLGYTLPADLVITTQAEIETREFTAYGHGWRDCVEHGERRGREALAAGDRRGREALAAGDRRAKILPAPQQKQSPPPDHPS